MIRLSLALALALAACGDAAMPPGPDLAVDAAVDLAAPDLSIDAATPDLLTSDLAGDLAPLPDLTADLATPDLRHLPPDLTGYTDDAGPVDLGPPDLLPAPAPTLTAVSPSSGSTAGGVPLVLTGTGFLPGLAVTVGGVAATDATWVSYTRATATLPPHPGAFGKVAVTVTNVDGQAATAPLFAYAAATANLAPPVAYAQVGAPWALALADLDGDGTTDVATALEGSSDVALYHGVGDGTLAASGLLGVGSNPYDVLARDIDGDGKLDLATCDASDGYVSVLLGRGKGVYGPIAVRTQAGMVPVALDATDWNGDGFADVAVAATAESALFTLLGKGDGSFATPNRFPIGMWGLRDVKLGDLDGDHIADAVAAVGVDVMVWHGTSSGMLTNQTPYEVDGAPQNVVLADVDGDGRTDVLTPDYGNDDVGVLLNKSLGGMPALTVAAHVPVPGRPRALAVVDLDGDGHLDVLAALVDAETVVLLRGDGAGDFATAGLWNAGCAPAALATADLDGDGKPDVVLACPDPDDRIVVLRNTSM